MSEVRHDRLLAAARLLAEDRLARLSAIEGDLRRIAEERRRVSRSTLPDGEPVPTGPCLSLWDTWCEQRLRQLAMREAALRAEREAARRGASVAVGRREVIRRLVASRSRKDG